MCCIYTTSKRSPMLPPSRYSNSGQLKHPVVIMKQTKRLTTGSLSVTGEYTGFM